MEWIPFFAIATILALCAVAWFWDRFYDWASGWRAPDTDIMGQHRPGYVWLGPWEPVMLWPPDDGYTELVMDTLARVGYDPKHMGKYLWAGYDAHHDPEAYARQWALEGPGCDLKRLQWSAEDLRKFTAEGRPALTINRIPHIPR